MKTAFETWIETAQNPTVSGFDWVDDNGEYTPAETETAPLPELTGSEKQTSWANEIRANMIKRMNADQAVLFSAGKYSSAKFWIDNRQALPRVLARSAQIEVLKAVRPECYASQCAYFDRIGF